VDGATAWRRFRRIKLPLLAPAMTISVTLTMIYGLRVFDQVLGLTGGGPDVSTETLGTQLYAQTFTFGYYGLGAALGVVMTALIAAVVVLQVTFLRARERRM
jgi:raffinose/stachyose/melibiose transport system permease protein